LLAGGFIPWLSSGQRVAVRVQNDPSQSGLYFLIGDHLGSTSLSYNAATHNTVTERYMPWGELRDGTNSLPTNYTYTGQYSYTANFGLMYYGVRFYDPSLNRWTQPDSIVPLATQGVQAFDRYAYSNNNPVTYIDPSGHWMCDPYDPGCAENERESREYEYMVKTTSGEFDPIPDPDTILCPEGCTYDKNGKLIIDVRPLTHQRYAEFRRELYLRYGMKYLTSNGMISNQALLAIIRWGEFGNILPNDVMDSVDHALSNQYASTYSVDTNSVQCNGECTMETQLLWLQIVPSFRYQNVNGYFDANGLRGYDDVAWMLGEPKGDEWMWGNLTANEENGIPDIPSWRILDNYYWMSPTNFFYVWHPRR
jgi:RHS repeat-associated protein